MMMKQSRQPETEKMVFRLPLDYSRHILLAIPRKHRQPENAIHRFRLPFSMVHLCPRKRFAAYHEQGQAPAPHAQTVFRLPNICARALLAPISGSLKQYTT